MNVKPAPTNTTRSANPDHSTPNTGAPTRLAAQVSGTASSSQRPGFPVSVPGPGVAAANNNAVEIPLYYPREKRDGDCIDDLNSFSEAWGAAYEHLTTQTLTEREVLDILKSGILHRKVGRNLEHVFVEAIMRSLQTKGDLPVLQLREIVEVVCHFPHDRWADTLGEHLGFHQGEDGQGVAGFIQSQLTESHKERDKKIAKGQLLTSAQWQCLCEIIEASPPWMNDRLGQLLDEEGPNRPEVDLEDIAHLRPSPDTACLLMSKCLQVLNQRAANDEVPAGYESSIHQLIRCIVEKKDPIVAAQRTVRDAVSFEFLKPFKPQTHLVIHVGGDSKRDVDFPLLKVLQEIERKSDFHDSVDTRAPGVPKGFVPRIMYALNCVENIRQLPGPAMDPGLRVMPRATVTTTPPAEQPRHESAAFAPGFIEQLEELAGQVDTLLTGVTHFLTGWNPVAAEDIADPRTLLNELENKANELNVAELEHQQSTVETWAVSLGEWLQGTAGFLAAASLATVNTAAGVVQQNPRATATVAIAAVYAVVLEFYNQWFPEGPPDSSHFVKEADSRLHGQIVNDVESSLNEMPAIARAIRERLVKSSYEDPHQDPLLVSDVAHLLEQPVPWNKNITGSELIVEGVEHIRNDFVQHHRDLVSSKTDEGTTEPIRLQRLKRAAEWTLETLNDSGALSTADKQLQNDVIAVMKSGRNTLVSVPAGTLLHSSVELYKQALNDPALLEFFTAKGLSLSTLRIHHNRVTGTVTENGETTTRAFSLWDDSGWWPAAKPLVSVLTLLDPDDFGLCQVSTESNAIPCDVILRFYGVEPPSTPASESVLANQLETSGWPEFSTGKKARLENAIEQVKQVAEEAEERAKLVTALELAVTNKADSAIVNLSQTMADFVSSPLVQASEEIRHHLNDFLVLPAMIELCQARNIDCSAFPARVSERKIQVFSESRWVDLTGAVNAQPALKAELDKLFEQTKKTGGALRSSPSFDLLQIIRFKGFDAPKNAGEVRNIIGWLATSIPPAPPSGNYGADLLADNPASVTLSSAEKTQIIELSKGLQDGSPSIIQALGVHLPLGLSVEYLRAHADRLLGEMLETNKADSWGRQLVEKLNWYGATEGQTASVEHYHQLLCTAIKLNVDPDVPGKLGNIAGYDVYQPNNRGRELGAIRADIENHLINDKGVSAQTAPLVAHLFLADVAPEFLVAGGNDNVLMGTVNWMTLRLGVAIAEATDQGCSRVMTDEQLMALAVLDPVTEENRLLFQSLGVDILVAWGVMNGVVRQRQTSDYSPGDYERAANMFARQRAEIAKSLQAFSRPLPARRELAILELRKVFPGASDRELEGMKLWSNAVSAAWNLEATKGTTHDLVEVYMSGDLNPTDWWQPNRGGMTSEEWARRIQTLPDMNTLLTASVDSYFADFSEGFIAPTKLMFAELPLEDRQSLELGSVELFTLRAETGKIKEDETPEHRAAVRGGYGTLIRSEYHGKISYFEVFPAQLKIVKRSDLPDKLPLNGEMKIEKARVSRNSPSNIRVQRGTELPFDFQAYTTGSAPRTHIRSPQLIIEKLGNNFPATPLVGTDETTYVPPGYFSPKLARIVSAVIHDNFLQGQKAVLFDRAKGLTPRDEQNQFWKNLKAYALQLIPFVGCASDLSSGTRMGLINGAFGCFTDAVSGLFALVGGAGKAASVLNSDSPFKVKAFEFMKTGVGTANSLINPASGLLDLLGGTARGVRSFGKMLTSRVFEITQNGLGRLQTGVDQIRCFLGGAAMEAGKKMPAWMNAEHKLVNGVNRGTNSTAIFQSNKWFGVDSRGKPVGPALLGFTPRNPKLQPR
ncbi:hypothetical protein J2Y86_000520 [Pseudomonas migulae]|uniref:hypothetical protein n=1 Tax=Pseudomonas migulae TaxID=78543 RepID=UPI00209DC98E|nr:hypothetical protein [Pseudomonas migulae]MCP1495813.1 hypothetical protein [Pseudomonas migulae]